MKHVKFLFIVLNIILFISCGEKDSVDSQFAKDFPEELTFSLSNPLDLNRNDCFVSMSIEDLEKQQPEFNSLAFILLCNDKEVPSQAIDNNGDEVAQKENNLGFGIGKEIEINVEGSFETEIELQSIKLKIYGFTLLRDINLRYGGEEASSISFDFT